MVGDGPSGLERTAMFSASPIFFHQPCTFSENPWHRYLDPIASGSGFVICCMVKISGHHVAVCISLRSSVLARVVPRSEWGVGAGPFVVGTCPLFIHAKFNIWDVGVGQACRGWVRPNAV